MGRWDQNTDTLLNTVTWMNIGGKVSRKEALSDGTFLTEVVSGHGLIGDGDAEASLVEALKFWEFRGAVRTDSSRSESGSDGGLAR